MTTIIISSFERYPYGIGSNVYRNRVKVCTRIVLMGILNMFLQVHVCIADFMQSLPSVVFVVS